MTRHELVEGTMVDTAHIPGMGAEIHRILVSTANTLDGAVDSLREIDQPADRLRHGLSVLGMCGVLLERVGSLTQHTPPTGVQEGLQQAQERLEALVGCDALHQDANGPQTGAQGFEPQEPVAEAEADECAYPVGSLWMDDEGCVWSITRVRGIQGPDVTCLNWEGGPGEISLTTIQDVNEAPLIRVPECLRELWDPAQSQEDIPVYRYAWGPTQPPVEMRRGSVWRYPEHKRPQSQQKYVVIGKEPSTNKPMFHPLVNWCSRKSWMEVVEFAVCASAFAIPLYHVRG